MSCRILNIKSPADADAVALFRRLAERGNPADGNGQDVENQVRAILADVRERGDQALLERTRQFDAPDMEMPFKVPQEELARAAASISGEERSGMGFTIMESFMDKLTVRSVPGKGTTVQMRKRIAPRMSTGR